MEDAISGALWWLAVLAIGISLGLWINSHLKFDSTNLVTVASGRALVFLMSIVFAAVLVIVTIEVILVAAY